MGVSRDRLPCPVPGSDRVTYGSRLPQPVTRFLSQIVLFIFHLMILKKKETYRIVTKTAANALHPEWLADGDTGPSAARLRAAVSEAADRPLHRGGRGLPAQQRGAGGQVSAARLRPRPEGGSGPGRSGSRWCGQCSSGLRWRPSAGLSPVCTWSVLCVSVQKPPPSTDTVLFAGPLSGPHREQSNRCNHLSPDEASPKCFVRTQRVSRGHSRPGTHCARAGPRGAGCSVGAAAMPSSQEGSSPGLSSDAPQPSKARGCGSRCPWLPQTRAATASLPLQAPGVLSFKNSKSQFHFARGKPRDWE